VTVILAVVFSLLTAVTNAASATLQWNTATKAPPEEAKGLHLAAYLVRQPQYLAAIATLTLSFLLQAAALHEGDVSFVQPLLVTELPFTLFMSALWLGTGLDRRELLGSAAICMGLGLFLGVGSPQGGRAAVPAGAWLVAAVAVAAVMGILVLIAHTGDSMRKTVAYALASGIAYAMTAVLVKGTTSRISGGIGHLLAGWEPYAMVLTGVMAVLLQQQSLHAGPLAAAKPATTVINPIASVILGVTVFQNSLGGGLQVVAEVFGGAILVAGIVELARSPLVTGHRHENPRHHDRLASGKRRSVGPEARRTARGPDQQVTAVGPADGTPGGV
jgi:drug/metabolite transporter (DMT)-like permease